MDAGVAVVKEVIEAATVEAVSGAAVTDVVEGAVFAELNGIHTPAGRNARTRTGTEGRPIVAGGVAAVGKLREEDSAGWIFDDGFLVPARIPIGKLAGRDATVLKVDAGAVSGVGERRGA